jgi:hypothetical protein
MPSALLAVTPVANALSVVGDLFGFLIRFTNLFIFGLFTP